MKRPSPFYRWNLGSNALQALLAAALLLFSTTAFAQTLTWDPNTGTTGAQNGLGNWNTITNNWWDGTANALWVNSAAAIANVGVVGGTVASQQVITLTENIQLMDLRFRAISNATPASLHQYTINGDVVGGRTLDFGLNGLIQMEDFSSGGSQFVSLGANLRLRGENLRIQKFGLGTAFQFITLGMSQNPDLIGTLTIGGSIYATITAPNTIQNVSRVVVEAGGSTPLSTPNANYTQAFSLAGFGNSLTNSGTSYGAIRFVSNGTTMSGGILLTADAGVHTNFTSGGANGTTGIVINSAITDGGSNFAFHRFAFTRGDGTLALAAANTYGGATVLGRALSSYSGGTTILDFTAATAPQNDILYNGVVTPGRLDFIGGNSVSVLRLSGKSGQTHSQRLGNVTVNGTHSALELLPGVGGTINVSLGSFSRTDNAATLSIIGPISGSISTTQSAGFIGPWLSYTDGNGSRSWGRSASGLITNRYIGDTTYATAQSLSSAPYAATSNVGITAASSGSVTMGAGVTLLNTLSMADLTADRVVQITTGQTLRLSTQGGIQIASGGRNLMVGDAAGTLSAGGGANNTAGQLFLSNQSTSGQLIVNSNITNNGTGLVTLVNNGAPSSRSILTGTNTHTGGTQVSSGVLEIRSAGALGTTGTVTVVDGATLALSGGITLSRALGAIGGFGDGNNGAIRSISGDNVITGAIIQNAMFMIAADAGASLTIQPTSAITYSSALTFGGAGTVTVNAALTGAGAVSKIGTGQLILGGNSTFTAATTVSAGTLRLASTTALGVSSAVTISNGASIDLNGFSSDRSFSSISGTGFSGNGALYNNSVTTSTVTGLAALAAAAKIGGTGNITFSNATGLTGNALLYKFGSGTLTVINSTTTSARSATTGVNQIDAGTLRLQSPLAIAPVGLGAYALNGGTLSLGFDVTNAANTGAVNMLSSSTIIADRASSGAGGIIHTLGALTIGGSTLTVTAGSNVTSSTIGLTLGTATIGGLSMRPGNPTFDVQSTASAAMTLTLGALSDQAIGPRTITFANTGAATTNSLVTLATAAGSLVDGTLVSLNNGTNAGVTLNLNTAAALGTLAQVSVNGNSVLNLGAAQTIGSLSGSGNITGAFVLTVGNANNASVLNTTYSGVLGFGGVATGLTKAGLGTLTLSGTNAYTGATAVNLGILRLNNASALGATSGVTIGAGGTLDLNGFSTDRAFTISGTGISSGGAIINSSGTTGTITGTVALAAVASMGGAGNITINNATGITGNVQLTKVGAGTLRIINTTTTSTRSGANQLNAGTLRLESAALTAVSPLGTTGVWTLNGGTLSLGFDTANALMTGAVTLNGNTTVITDVATLNNAAVTQTMGSLTINNNSTLTIKTGTNVLAGGTQGMTFGVVVLNSGGTFDVQNTASATTRLTLGALTDFAIAPRTLTFTNTGDAITNSLVTLATAAGSLVDGTVVNLNNGTNAGVTLNMTSVTALGALSRVTVNGNSTLTAGVTSIVLGSLAGNGTVNASGAFTLIVGNSNTSTALNTSFSGVLTNGTGTLALTKAGLGTLTLDGSSSNTHSGATIVNSGTLILAKSGGATALAGPLTIGALAASTAGNATVRLGGDGQMAVSVADVNNLTINAGGTLDMNGRTLTVNTLASFFGSTITGSGTLVINRTGGTIGFGGINTLGSTLQITTANSGNATRTVSLVNATDQVTFGGSVTQAVGLTGTITKTGSGTLILSGDNSYSGITTVSAGMINIRHGNALGTTTGNTVVSSGGTLQIQGGITTAAEGLVPIGSGFAGVNGIGYQTGAVVNVSGTNNYAGLVTLSTAPGTISSDSGTLNLTHAGTLAGAQVLILAGAGDGSISSIIGATVTGVTKNGTGTWTLKGVNASTGPLTINAGVLKLGDGATGRYSSAPGLTYTGSGTFEFGGSTAASTQALGALTLASGGGTLIVAAPGSGSNGVTFTSLVTPAIGTGLNIVSPASTSVTITGATNTNGIVDARLTFNGADYASSAVGVIGAAATTAATSSLVGGNSSPYLISGSFAQTSSVIANAGLKFASSSTFTINNGVLLTINNGANTAGGLLVAGAVSAIIANEGTATGLTTEGSGDLVIRTDVAGDSLDIQAPITSTTTGGLTKNGLGTLTLSAANAYGSATFINAGRLVLGNAAALSASAATVQVGAVLDLNGLSITNTATLHGTGISSGGALINNSVTAASIGALTIGFGNGTGGIGASIGGTGNISSTGALTGDSMLVKTGAGTLTLGNNGVTALASTRSGLVRIDAGTLRISNSTSAIGAATSVVILNGGTLSLGSTASVVAYPTSVTDSSAIVSDAFVAGAGLTHTLGVLAIGGHTLTVSAGSNVTTASTNGGIAFGATTLLGSPTFDVQSPATATSGTTTLTLGALNDLGVARTINFVNTGAATTNSVVTLTTAMTSLIDGTIVNLNNGTNAGVALNLNIAAALGTLAQVSVNGNSVLSLGAAQTIGSLSGTGNVIGAFALTIGNANSSSVLNTTYSGVLGFGGVATGLTKAGLGTLTLSGANAYTGATAVNLGILRLNNASALGATSGVTIGAGGTLDLNGFATSRNFTSISGPGINNGGAIINTSGTTGTITGTVVLAAHSSLGGTGNITINNATGVTGNFQLTKLGAGTLTIINTTTTSTRTGANQLNAGTLRLESAALTAVSPLGTTGVWTLNGGTLSLGFDTANALMTGAVTLNGNTTVITDVATSNNVAVTQTMGALTINNGSTLTVQTGSNVFSGGTQGMTFGAVTLNGNAAFDVQNSATATTRLTTLAISDLAIAPRTITFTNSGAAATNSLVTLATAAGSLVDGTVVNINNGTNAGVTLNLNIAAALGTLAQVNVNGNSVLSLGAAQTIGSLSGTGNVTGAFVLTVGNANNVSVPSTTYSGVLGFGGVATGLTKAGLGTLTLSGANAYTGATIVSTGILRLNNASALGTTSGVTISAGGTVDLNGQNTDRNFASISGTGHNGGGAIINSSGTTSTISGTTVLAAVTKMGGSGNITFNNTGGLTGSFLLTKFGSGTLTVISTATSARTGTNQIDEGTLRVQAATSITPIGTGVYALNGGTLSLGFDVSNPLPNAVNLLANSTIIVDRASSGSGGIAHNLAALTIGGNTLTVKAGDNVTSSTIGLTLGTTTIGGTQLAPGNPTFDVQSSASASTTLTLGAISDQAIAPRTITFQNSGNAASAVALGTAATSLVDGTVVNLANTGGPVTLNLNITNALGTFAQITVASGNTLSLAAGQTFSALNGSGTVSASTPAVMTIGNILSPTISNSVFNGVLAGGANLSMVKAGTGSMTLSGAASNTYSGSAGTVVTGGTLILAKTDGATAISTNLTIDATGTAAGTAAVRLEGSDQILTTAALTMNTGATFDLNGFNQSVGNLNGTDGATIQNNASSTNVTLTIGTGNATGGVYLGRITDNSSGTGTVAVTKLGSGVAAFGGSSSYSGATTVQAGSLQVGIGGIGQSGTGATTISNGGTVYGTGVIRGTSFTAASGSTVHAGDGIAQANYGTLHFTPASGSGVLDFQSGSTVILGINPGGTSDRLNFVGTGTNTLLFDANLTITATTYTPVAAETFNLLDWSGLSSSPTFASRFSNIGRLFGNGDEASGLDLPDISTSDYYWDMSNFTTNGTIAVMLVPEPSRAACLLIAGLAVFLRSSRYRS
jgi:fibronectin-binding autotransporter adhesin